MTILPFSDNVASSLLLLQVQTRDILTLQNHHRPVIRPGNERSKAPPSPFPFTPTTPPTAEPDTKHQRPVSSVGRDTLVSSNASTFKNATQTVDQPNNDAEENTAVRSPPSPTTRVRAHSFSTVDDTNRPSLDKPGTFRVIIHQPSVKRSKSVHAADLPVLQVPIPHYRLGQPQFDISGAAILRSSAYTRSTAREEPRSSFFSQTGNDRLHPTSSGLQSSFVSRRHSEAFPQPLSYRGSAAEQAESRVSVPPNPSTRPPMIQIDSTMYDTFVLNPNDPSVVRYSASTNEIVAATPIRLIAHITSPSFLDYELLSDFFLTFRLFVRPRDLVSFLVARLRWAVDRQDDFGRIVRVRTFVALRHWILNYFVDDFVTDHELRKHFCDQVNALYEDLRRRHDNGGGDIKIVGELKKCWRRTCVLYWDVPDGIGKDAAEDEIIPGGQLGSRSSSDTALPASAPSPQPSPAPPAIAASSQTAKPSTMELLDEPKTPTHIPQPSQSSAPYSFPHTQSSTHVRPIPLSPSSDRSTQILSCSLPMKPIYRSEQGQDIPLFPHPVPAPTAHVSPSPSAAIAAMPGSHHKRSGSFTDALRDNREPLSLPKNGNQDMQIPSGPVIPGCLVRGALYQPTAPYFDVKRMAGVTKSKSYFEPGPIEPHAGHGGRHHRAQNPGVKNILGSVRRALSHRQMSPSRSGFGSDLYSARYQGSEVTLPSVPSEKSAQSVRKKRSQPLTKSQVRIDILAARVLESFKETMTQMEREQAAENGLGSDQRNTSDKPVHPEDLAQRFNRSVTVGSRSIVIVDDTNSDLHLMSGGLAPPSLPSSPPKDKAAEAEFYKPAGDQRVTLNAAASIDGVLAKQDVPSQQPAVYMPTGFGTLRDASSIESRRSAAPAPDIPRRNPHNSLSTDPSSVSTLRKYASFHAGDVWKQPEEDTQAEAELEPTGDTPRKSSSELDPSIVGQTPVRQLRRRPGGDLKAVSKVHDLEQPRAKSVGSISTASQSIIGSLVMSPQPSQSVPTTTSPVSPPITANDSPSLKRRSISLIQTHSSQPNLRPSFEAEVAKLAALPDNEEDGGIESALLKLEGKYEKKTPNPSPDNNAFDEAEKQDSKAGERIEERRQSHRKEHAEGAQFANPLPPEAQTTSVYQLSPISIAPTALHRKVLSRSVAESEESYSSVPLLERGLSDAASRTKKLAQVISNNDDLTEKIPGPGHAAPFASKRSSPPLSGSSLELVDETESLKQMVPADEDIHSPTIASSFLFDEDEGSEVSNEVAGGSENETQSHGVRSFFDDELIDDEPDTEIFTHPLRHPDTPPSKTPVTLDPTNINPTTNFNQGLPTPGPTPTAKLAPPPSSPTRKSPPPLPNKLSKMSSEATRPTGRATAHLPFILAHEPANLARQLTIIEKDALDEIDWKELIELRWSHTAPPVSDWVQYLLTQDPRGVDLVIARFNLVVKWVKSEIMLCENIDDRAACVTHYIRVARECRRIRNYASMYQISVALLSTDVARLRRTWDFVPDGDREVMEGLEKVVQPLRNFMALRSEMEAGTGEEGCVPFIGMLISLFLGCSLQRDNVADGNFA